MAALLIYTRARRAAKVRQRITRSDAKCAKHPHARTHILSFSHTHILTRVPRRAEKPRCFFLQIALKLHLKTVEGLEGSAASTLSLHEPFYNK